MSSSKRFSAEEATRVGEQIGIDWETVPFDVEQFRAGMDVELEHGTHDPATNVTDDDPTDHRIRNLIPMCVDGHRKATYPGI